MKQILVTGANGFVGKNLIPKLLKKYRVTVITRSSKKMHGSKVTYLSCDLNKKLPSRAIVAVDAIVHLASRVDINDSLQNPKKQIEENLAMTLNLLEAVRASDRTPLIIFASTDRQYGQQSGSVTEESPTFPIEPYTASKMMSETVLAAYAHLYGIPYIVLRFDSIYGPHQPRAMFISDIINKMIESDRITTGALNVRKNFVYVGDVAKAIVQGLKAKPAAYNQAYNIGGPQQSLEQILQIIQISVERTLKKNIRVESKSPARAKKVEVRGFTLSTAKAQRILKWKPETSLKKGLAITIDHFLTS